MSAPVLRPATAEDCEAIAGWLNDPAIHGMLSSNLRSGGIDARALAMGLRRRDQMWMVFAPHDTAPPAGLIALDSIDAGDGVANIWFLLGEKTLGRKGLTSSAIARFCEENPAGVHVLTAWIVDGNDASVACMLKAGFEETGRVREGVSLDGGRRDRILMQRVVGNP